MKTVQFKQYGDIKSSLVFSEIDIPLIKDNEVLVEIHSASINPIDYKIVEGALKMIEKLSFPAPLGYDMAGVIVEKGVNVKNLDLGDKVYARVGENQRGTFAEYIAVDSSVISKMPKSISFSEASSIPLVGLTTVQSFEKARIKPREKVLIHAGSGGVGTFAIQYAKAMGAIVYTTSSTYNIDMVERLGADIAIDYKKEDYLKIVKDMDVVYDTLGGNYTSDAFKVLRKGGRVVSIAGTADDETARKFGLNGAIRMMLKVKRGNITRQMNAKSAHYKYIMMQPNSKQLDKIGSLIEAGRIKPVIDKEFPMSEAKEALLYLKTGRVKGKVTLKIK